jgi:hypothetical protein
MGKESALLIVVAMVLVVSSGCVKNYSTSKDIVLQTMPSDIIKKLSKLATPWATILHKRQQMV